MRVFNGAFAAATLVTAAIGGQLGPVRLALARAEAVGAEAVPAKGRALAYAHAGTADEIRARAHAGAGDEVRGRAHAGAGGEVQGSAHAGTADEIRARAHAGTADEIQGRARAGAGGEVQGRADAVGGDKVRGRARASARSDVRGLAHASGHAGRRGGGHVYVWNLYGDERGRRDERPVGLVLSEHATLTHLHWSGWGGAGASGTGRFSGTMCLPGCLKRPYPASVTLGRVRKTHGARYYTGFKVKVDVPDQGQGPSSLSGALPTP